jgi:signal transduction histidine kinase
LGLSICQSVVHNHGGEIDCESEVDRGTTFTVTLPLAEAGWAAANQLQKSGMTRLV